jgi:hypothetical protein
VAGWALCAFAALMGVNEWRPFANGPVAWADLAMLTAAAAFALTAPAVRRASPTR